MKGARGGRRLPAGLVAGGLAGALVIVGQSGYPLASPVSQSPSFTLFESGQVRPLALSPDGSTLFAVNTPDNRVEVFGVTATGLVPRGSVAVGLEPVAIAARTDEEVWVVNHLSDSVSIVRLADRPGDQGGDGHGGDGRPRGRESSVGRVVRTLLVGDEPRDIVFGGVGRSRAFITTAHRGQNARTIHSSRLRG